MLRDALQQILDAEARQEAHDVGSAYINARTPERPQGGFPEGQFEAYDQGFLTTGLSVSGEKKGLLVGLRPTFGMEVNPNASGITEDLEYGHDRDVPFTPPEHTGKM